MFNVAIVYKNSQLCLHLVRWLPKSVGMMMFICVCVCVCIGIGRIVTTEREGGHHLSSLEVGKIPSNSILP